MYKAAPTVSHGGGWAIGETSFWHPMEYQCPDYPYVYNEEAGDPDNGISLVTKFEDWPAK